LFPTAGRGDRHIQDRCENRLAKPKLDPDRSDITGAQSGRRFGKAQSRCAHGELAFAFESVGVLTQARDEDVAIEGDLFAGFNPLRRRLF
jgi:hypothetical protein